MNIFFLSMSPSEIADMSCDQHVVKIILEICQMLYTAWYFSGESHIVADCAPFNKNNTARGYRPAHKGHPMTMWVASSRANYIFAADIALALAKEYTLRYGKIHSCQVHAEWLRANTPSHFELRKSPKAYYATNDVLPGLTPIPECMPDDYKMPSIIDAYKMYYMMDKMEFARYTPKSKLFCPNAKDELDEDSLPNLGLHREGVEECRPRSFQ